MTQRDTVIHLVAGGVAGTVGAIVTCPLEVVKTRLQSSRSGFSRTNGGGASFTLGQEDRLMPPQMARDDAAASAAAQKQTTCRTLTNKTQQQRRTLWTSSCHLRSPQVVALSGYVGPPHPPAPSLRHHPTMTLTAASTHPHPPNTSIGLVQCLRHIVKHEGPLALFKGLGPNLVGVAPSRAVYFCTYSQAKQFWNSLLSPNSPIVHMLSASCAGFMASTLTNPIWFVKTRLQLDFASDGKRMTALQCVRQIYNKSGILGFYKGITASYMGISETIVHFVIYEALKAELIARHNRDRQDPNTKDSRDFLEFMMAGAVSKTIASCVAYPHEVARTRLREEGSKYKSFWQTLSLVAKEEGVRGVYRGLTTQLIRQIPNTAIMMATYEAVVYILSTRFENDFYTSKTESENI